MKEYPEQVTFAETLALLFNNQETPVTQAKVDPLTREFLKMKSDLKSLHGFNDPARDVRPAAARLGDHRFK